MDMDFGPFSSSIGAAAFWMFIAAVSVAGTITGYLSNRETQRTIRQALELGQDVDPKVLDKLLGRDASKDTPAGRIAAGVITMASGLGVGVIGVFLGIDDGKPVWVIIGAGILVILVGIALFGLGLWMQRLEQDDRGA